MTVSYDAILPLGKTLAERRLIFLQSRLLDETKELLPGLAVGLTNARENPVFLVHELA